MKSKNKTRLIGFSGVGIFLVLLFGFIPYGIEGGAFDPLEGIQFTLFMTFPAKTLTKAIFVLGVVYGVIFLLAIGVYFLSSYTYTKIDKVLRK